MENLFFSGVFVVIMITPLAPAAPYTAVEDASFSTSMDAISFGFNSSYEPSIPSMINSGSLDPLMERVPLKVIFISAPASPLLRVMSKPATCP